MTSHRIAHAALAAALSVVVLSTLLLGGSAYRWCVPMQRAMSACCCVGDPHGARDQAPAVTQPCCELRAIGSLARAQTPRDDSVAKSLPLAAAVAPARVEASFALPRNWPVSVPIAPVVAVWSRAGPPPAHKARAILQILRC